MVKRYSIRKARGAFAQVIREAEQGIQVEFTRRGKTVAILIGVENHERTSKGFWEAYEKFRREHTLEDIDPGEIFGDVRDPSPGRDFNW